MKVKHFDDMVLRLLNNADNRYLNIGVILKYLPIRPEKFIKNIFAKGAFT